MRNLSELTKEEVTHIAELIGDDVKSWRDVEYRAFGKSRCIYSGYTVVRLYKYLVSINVDAELPTPALFS